MMPQPPEWPETDGTGEVSTWAGIPVPDLPVPLTDEVEPPEEGEPDGVG